MNNVSARVSEMRNEGVEFEGEGVEFEGEGVEFEGEGGLERFHSPVVISVQALMSRMTPLGDSPSVVRTIVISRRDTGVLEGISVISKLAGFVVSSFGLVVDKIGLSLILFPSVP
jgi:hypothetical protein